MNTAKMLRGAAALQEMLDCIGNPDPNTAQPDQIVAKILVENEMELRALVRDALALAFNRLRLP